MDDRDLRQLLAYLGEPDDPREDSIWAKWWRWHLAHLQVEAWIVAQCHQALRRGFKHWSIAAIWEVLRWHFAIEKGEEDVFKCPNAFRSRYARYIMWKYPELRGFFRTIPLTAE